MAELIKTIGYTETSEPGIFMFEDMNQFKTINKAALILDDVLDPIKLMFMTPEEAEKHKLLVERKMEARIKA